MLSGLGDLRLDEQGKMTRKGEEKRKEKKRRLGRKERKRKPSPQKAGFPADWVATLGLTRLHPLWMKSG